MGLVNRKEEHWKSPYRRLVEAIKSHNNSISTGQTVRVRCMALVFLMLMQGVAIAHASSGR
ncbi:MAG: hypothetical protein P8Q98_00145, partial [Candidatus Poseidoniaceae archaeon]|nr:hypothetical protein [Candidatus Poseidoniaceae archaeon]